MDIIKAFVLWRAFNIQSNVLAYCLYIYVFFLQQNLFFYLHFIGDSIIIANHIVY